MDMWGTSGSVWLNWEYFFGLVPLSSLNDSDSILQPSMHIIHCWSTHSAWKASSNIFGYVICSWLDVNLTQSVFGLWHFTSTEKNADWERDENWPVNLFKPAQSSLPMVVLHLCGCFVELKSLNENILLAECLFWGTNVKKSIGCNISLKCL